MRRPVLLAALLAIVGAGLMAPGSAVADAAAGNDEITGATVITAVPSRISQPIAGATSSPSDPVDCADGVTTWYAITAPRTGKLRLMVGSDSDTNFYLTTTVSVFRGSPGSLVPAGCDVYDSNAESVTPMVFPAVAAGERLYVAVGAVHYVEDGILHLFADYVENVPPVLTAPVKAAFAVGGTLGVGTVPDCAPQTDTWDLGVSAPVRFAWSATDASGPVRYDLFAMENANGGDYVFENSSATSYDGSSTTWDQTCGGGNWSISSWTLTARDQNENSVDKDVLGGRMRVTQEDGRANTTSQYAVAPKVAYAGSWGTSRCVCWSAGTVRRTTAKGAAVTLTVPVAVGGVVHAALVMTTGPDRGKAKVYVDGVLHSTVDTYAPASRNRVIVWEKALGKGTHTIKVVNEATAGRPRIDLDAVLTN